MVLDAANDYSGSDVVQAGTLDLAATGAAGSGIISLVGGVLWVEPRVAVGNYIKGHSTAEGLAQHSDGLTIDLRGIKPITITTTLLPGNTLEVSDAGGDSIALKLDPSVIYPAGKFYINRDGAGGSAITDGVVACFLRGTRIAAATGERAVERLRIGGIVRTAGDW